jgi:hypothetical protein
LPELKAAGTNVLASALNSSMLRETRETTANRPKGISERSSVVPLPSAEHVASDSRLLFRCFVREEHVKPADVCHLRRWIV